MSDDHSLDSALVVLDVIEWDLIPLNFVELDSAPDLNLVRESGSGLINHCPYCGQRALAVQKVRVASANSQSDVSP